MPNHSLRAFFAISLPKDIYPYLLDVQTTLQQSLPPSIVRWTEPQNLHLTLRFLPKLNQADIAIILNRLSPILATYKPLELSWQPLTLFPQKNASKIIAYELHPLEHLDHIVQHINKVLRALHYPDTDNTEFRPHITIARLKQPLKAVELPLQACEDLPPHFKATDIYLMESRTGGPASHYIPLGKIILQESAPQWEHFDHDADIGIRGKGLSLAAAFEEAGLALTNLVTDSSLVKPSQTVRVRCEAPTTEFLFYDWINAIIYEMASQNILFSQFVVKLQGCKLSAELSGEAVDLRRHQPAVDVKGATFTELAVYESNQFWVVQCVVDV